MRPLLASERGEAVSVIKHLRLSVVSWLIENVEVGMVGK